MDRKENEFPWIQVMVLGIVFAVLTYFAFRDDGKPSTLTVTLEPGEYPRGENPEYWLYLDGRLIAHHHFKARLSKPLELEVRKGKHIIDVMTPTRPAGPESIVWPFHLESKEITVSAAQQSVTLPLVDPAPIMLVRPGEFIPDPQKWIARLEERAKKEIPTVEANSIFRMVREALSTVSVGQTIVRLKLPKGIGGEREFDAVQVLAIVGWLDRELFYWFPHSCSTAVPASTSELLPSSLMIGACERLLENSVLERYLDLKADVFDQRRKVLRLTDAATLLEPEEPKLKQHARSISNLTEVCSETWIPPCVVQ